MAAFHAWQLQMLQRFNERATAVSMCCIKEAIQQSKTARIRRWNPSSYSLPRPIIRRGSFPGGFPFKALLLLTMLML